MKRTSLIVTSMSAIAAAVTVGYFGVQHLGRNTMLAIGGGMIAVGTVAQVVQMKSKRKVQQTRLKQPTTK